MKAILEFNLPEDRFEHTRAVKGTDAYIVLWEVSQQIFRPARKHGYLSDPKLNQLLGGDHGDAVEEAIGLLEDKFHELLRDRGISLEDLE